MGTIAFTVTDAIGPASKTFTVPDAQLARMIVAYQSAANVAVNGTATRGQVLNYIVRQWMDTTVQEVKNYEAQLASSTAIAGVSPMTPV